MDTSKQNEKPNIDTGSSGFQSKYIIDRRKKRTFRKDKSGPNRVDADLGVAPEVKDTASERPSRRTGKFLVNKNEEVRAESRYFDDSDSANSLSRRLTVISIYLYTASLYFFASWPQLNIISRLLFVIMVVMTAVDSVINGIKVNFDYTMISMIAFVALYGMSSLWVTSQDYVVMSISTVAQLLVLYMVLRLNIRSMKDIHHLLMAIIVGTMIMCVYFIWYYGLPNIFSSIITGNRIGREVNQANMVGIYNSILCAVIMYYVLFEKKRWFLVMVPVAVLVLIAGGSRKGFILLILAFFIPILLRVSPRKRVVILIVTGVLLAALIAVSFALAEKYLALKRLAELFSIFEEEQTIVTDQSLNTRQNMITYGLQLFTEKPLFGHGPVQFEYYWSLLHGLRRPPHSTYIQILVATGISGLILYYGQYVYYFRNMIRMAKARMRFMPLMVTLIAMVLFGDVGASLLADKYNFVLMALISGYFVHAKKLYALGKNDDDHLIPVRAAEEDGETAKAQA